MMTLAETIDAFMASDCPADVGSHGRLIFWREELGQLPLLEITADDVDDAVLRLAQRGKLKAGRGLETSPSGKPLAPATLTRYVTTLGGVYRWARKSRLIKKTHRSPTEGVEKPASPVDPNKFLSEKDVERLITAARVTDQQWGKLPAMIILGYHTGLRLGSLQSLRWCDIDWEEQQASVRRTKNGDPHVAALTDRCMAELKKLPRGRDDDLIFGGRTGKPFRHTAVWKKTVALIGLPHVTFHWLRHSTGAKLAKSGVNQAMIMSVMGHKTLTASARYMHSNVVDRRKVVMEVFS